MGRSYFQDKTYHTHGYWFNDETATFNVYYGSATELDHQYGEMVPLNSGSVFSQISQGTWFTIIGGSVVFVGAIIFVAVRRKKRQQRQKNI